MLTEQEKLEAEKLTVLRESYDKHASTYKLHIPKFFSETHIFSGGSLCCICLWNHNCSSGTRFTSLSGENLLK